MRNTKKQYSSSKEFGRGKPNDTWIYGRHAVVAAVKSGRRKVYEIWLIKEPEGQEKVEVSSFKIKIVTRHIMGEKFPNAVHQGIAAKVGELEMVALQDVWHSKRLLVLDQVTDPHNLGAILRSADAFGCGGVIMPLANSTAITDVVAKTACGALETVPIVQCNLARALDELKKKDYWVIGLDGGSKKNLADLPRYEKTCLVMGSEGSGLRPLVSKKCDFIAKLPMEGTMESLNVSVASAIALYEMVR